MRVKLILKFTQALTATNGLVMLLSQLKVVSFGLILKGRQS